MKKALLILTLLALSACHHLPQQAKNADRCTEAWYKRVEAVVPTGDGMGHGPDIGSDEWKSVVEFKLGIRGSSIIPGRNTPQWCAHIDKLIFN